MDSSTENPTFSPNPTNGSDPDLHYVILYATSLGLIMVFALISNIVALVTILRVQSLRQTPHNMLILNLCIADLGRALLVMPFSLTSTLDNGDYFNNNAAACKVIGFLSIFLVFINFITIALIAIDRVIVVTSCNKCGISDWTRVQVMLVFSWLIAGVIAAVLPTMGKGWTIEYREEWRICSVTMVTFGRFAMILMIGIVFPTMVVSYTIIAVLLWKRDRKLTRRRRRGLRATVVEKPSRPLPTSPVGLRRVTFDMKSTVPEKQPKKDLQRNKEQTVSHCPEKGGCISTSGASSSERPSQNDNKLEVELVSKEENTYENSLAWKHKEAIKRNRNGVVMDDGQPPGSSVSPTERVAPVRFGLGARLSALINIKRDFTKKEDAADGEQENCVIKGFKSAHGTGFTPGTSIYSAGTGQDDTGTAYKSIIDIKTRRLSNLFGSLKGIVGLGHYGRDEDDDDEFTENCSDRDDEQTCDLDSEPSQTMTTYSMSPSMAEFAQGKDDDEVGKSSRVRRRSRKTKLEKLRNMRQRRVAWTGVLLVCCNIVFTVPLAIWPFFKPPPPDWFGVLASWLSYCITIADPLVYAFMNRRVKKELKMYRKAIANSLPCKSKDD